jgi:hypothetical protein
MHHYASQLIDLLLVLVTGWKRGATLSFPIPANETRRLTSSILEA